MEGGSYNLENKSKLRFGKGRSRYLIPLVLLLIGAGIPVVEYLAPNHYSEDTMNLKMQQFLSPEKSPFLPDEIDDLKSFLDSGGKVIYGRALYPRYFQENQEIMDTIEYYFSSSMAFYISGTDIEYAVMPMNQPPEFFPHGYDVIAVGCEDTSIELGGEQVCLHCKNGVFSPLVVVLLDDDGERISNVYWRDGEFPGDISCPFPSSYVK